MSFSLQSLVGEPRIEEFNSLKKAELLQVAQHFKLTVNTSMGKGEIKKIELNHLVEEELLPEEELENVNTREDHLELKKLEFHEREREVQLRLRELEIREKELAVEYKTKEIELHNAKSMGGLRSMLDPLLMWESISVMCLHFRKQKWINIYAL